LEKIAKFFISQIEGEKKPWYKVKRRGKKITKTFPKEKD